jgi:GxxExxY protein
MTRMNTDKEPPFRVHSHDPRFSSPESRTHMRNKSELIHEDLSRQIIGAAMTVLNELGPGLGEKLYENALVIELAERGLCAETQQDFPVYYKRHFIGKLIPDLIVNTQVIVDTKVIECFNQNHFAQVMGYLAITRLELGLLLNFKYPKLQWRRIVRSEGLLPEDKYTEA